MSNATKLKSSISITDLIAYTTRQLNNLFPDNNIVEAQDIEPEVKLSMDRVEFNFGHINLPYYFDGLNSVFNHLHGDQYCIYLCYLGEALFKAGKESIASKVFLLNKSLHGIDAFYGLNFPDIFMVVHPIGTILGRAKYADRMVFYQGVTIGTDLSGVYPTFSGNHILYSKSSIIGNCKLEEGVNLGANALLINKDVSKNINVVGSHPNIKLVSDTKNITNSFFKS